MNSGVRTRINHRSSFITQPSVPVLRVENRNPRIPMRRPCPLALSMSRIPAKKWETRDELLARMEMARRWIAEAPGRHSLKEIAVLAAISPYHFHRLFRATYGQTPQSYISECRWQRAKSLLESGATVEGACDEVGFSSTSSFSRQFKLRFGDSPGSIRKGRSHPR